ncbi:hypothetical protein B1M_03357 [Burkholderia sp. TJI49]|nr:hypothetical protein B1M_03357 [Burkholderia sp. TJI49]
MAKLSKGYRRNLATWQEDMQAILRSITDNSERRSEKFALLSRTLSLEPILRMQ